ncbi:hypothetical protein D9M68_449480 [compost metagenome]
MGLHQRLPIKATDYATGDADRVAVILGQILSQARGARVHLGAAQFLFRRDFTRCSLEQRRPGQEGTGAAAHHDHDIRQPRHIGAACRARTMLYRDDWDARCRQPRQIAEQGPAAHKTFHAIAHEVGPRAFHQIDEGQLVLQRNLLGSPGFLSAHGLHGAGIDARVIGHHHAAHAADPADAGDHATAGHGLVQVRGVHTIACQGTQRQPGPCRIQQQRHALPGQQLIALLEHGQRPGRCIRRTLLQRMPGMDAREQCLATMRRLR